MDKIKYFLGVIDQRQTFRKISEIKRGLQFGENIFYQNSLIKKN